MTGAAKYIWAALAMAVLAHFAFVLAAPRVLMGAAIARVSDGSFNAWRMPNRVTPASRTIVRPSPDFAYSACPYDLSGGPVTIHVEPWDAYWSLSLYAANSDNFFVVDDREVRGGVTITLVRRPPRTSEDSDSLSVTSPSVRGIALIRRLAPTVDAFNAASRVAQGDVCAAQS